MIVEQICQEITEERYLRTAGMRTSHGNAVFHIG